MTQAPYSFVARVRMHASASEVAARVPPTVAQVTPETATTSLLVAGADDLDAMAHHLMAVGLDFEVLEAEALRDTMRVAAARLAAGAGPGPPAGRRAGTGK